MLGRTRPASRILLQWPRSTIAIRSITTTTATATSSRRGTDTESKNGAREDGKHHVGKPRKTFRKIRRTKFSGTKDFVLGRERNADRSVTSDNSAGQPVLDANTPTKDGIFGGALKRAHTRNQASAARRSVPGSPVAADDSSEASFRKFHVGNGSHASYPQRSGGEPWLSQTELALPGTSTGVELKTTSTFTTSQGKAFSLNPEFAVKQFSNAGPFSANPDFVRKSPAGFSLRPELAKRPFLPGTIPSRTSETNALPQVEDVKLAREAEAASSDSFMLAENIELQSSKDDISPSDESPDLNMAPVFRKWGELEETPEDDGPPRSEIIHMMQTWNYIPEIETDADTNATEITTENTRRVLRGEKERLPPLERGFRDWLITAIDEAVSDATQNRSNQNGIAVYNGPTVLVLNGASRSLLESDFYRLTQQGQHIGDWAVGIARVVQARDPKTYEPLGKYYIFFHTRAAALAYSEEVHRLHELSRNAAELISASASSIDSGLPGPLPLGPTLTVDKCSESDLAALRGFTLLPHSARLELKLHLCKDLAIPAEDGLSSLSRDLSASTSGSSNYLRPGHHFVLLSLDGAKMTVASLQRAIDDDGTERGGVPSWGIVAPRPDGSPSIAAVAPNDANERDNWFSHDKRAADHPSAQFWRFIVPFTEVADARRFVMNWHRREMRDPDGRNMIVVFNATVLW